MKEYKYITLREEPKRKDIAKAVTVTKKPSILSVISVSKRTVRSFPSFLTKVTFPITEVIPKPMLPSVQ